MRRSGHGDVDIECAHLMSTITYRRNGKLVGTFEAATQRGMSPKEWLATQGRAAWAWLHAEAAAGTLTERRLALEFEPQIPRYGCGCLKEWQSLMTSIEFRPDDQERWAIEIHNAVNQKLGKPLWP